MPNIALTKGISIGFFNFYYYHVVFYNRFKIFMAKVLLAQFISIFAQGLQKTHMNWQQGVKSTGYQKQAILKVF